MSMKILQTCRLHANGRVVHATLPGHKVISGVSCLCEKRLVREKRAFEFCNQDAITNRTSFSVREKSEIGPVTRRHTAYLITWSCLLLSYCCCSLYCRPKACLYLMELASQLSWDYLHHYNMHSYALCHFFKTGSHNCKATMILHDITYVRLQSKICNLQLKNRHSHGVFSLILLRLLYIHC